MLDTRTVNPLGSKLKLMCFLDQRALSSSVRFSVKCLNSAKNTNGSVIETSLKPDQTGETLCYDTVRTLFNLQISIYKRFPVVTLNGSTMVLCHKCGNLYQILLYY